MSLPYPWIRPGVLALGLAAASSPSFAQEALDIGRYVEIVLRSHPAAAQSAGLGLAAEAERKSARAFPDPVFEYSRARATPTGGPGGRATETAWSVSQTIPWPGTFSAGVRAGDRAADVLRAGADGVRWELTIQARQAFARLVSSRALLDFARGAEEDARSLRDLVDAPHGARRVARVGPHQGHGRVAAPAARPGHGGAGGRGRRGRRAGARGRASPAAAGRPAGRPTSRCRGSGPTSLANDHVERSPRLRAARAEAERQQALLSVARRSRIPDLDVTVFKQRELDKEANGFAIGVKVPLWNANRGGIARADAISRISCAEADRVRIELVTELQGRLKELQVAGDQATLLDRELLPAAERSVSLVRLSFEEGETSLLDLLDAQRTYRDTQREAAEAHLALSLALGEVQKLAGPDLDPWR